jgi:hypothetical protein
VDAALEAILEMPLAPTAGVDLGFDDQLGAREFLGGGSGFLGGGGDPALGAGDSELVKQLLGLVFVDVHDAEKFRATLVCALGWVKENARL